MTEPKEPSAIIIPFGKHKGATVAELLAKDPAYADWITAQGWVAERFAELHAAILSRGAGTDDTPEHNAIQVRFLDPVFRAAFLTTVADRWLPNAKREAEKWHREEMVDALKHCNSCVKRLRGSLEPYLPGPPPKFYGRSFNGEWIMGDPTPSELAALAEAEQELKETAEIAEAPVALHLVTGAVYEQRGVDVVLRFAFVHAGDPPPRENRWPERNLLSIEIKPSVGDDFPSVMRQMSRLGASYLLVGEYNGRGAAFPQVREMFAANRQTVALMQEIEAEIPNARVLLSPPTPADP